MTPDTAALNVVVDQALLPILITELRVNSRYEILPTYRVGAPGFAHRQVQWAILDSNQGPLPYQRSALTD